MMTKPRSLRQRVLLPALILGVVGALTTIGVSGWITFHDYLNDLRRRGQQLASGIQLVAENVTRSGELQRIVTAKGAERDVTLIVVVGEEPARVLASTRVAWFGKPLASLPAERVGDDLQKVIASGAMHSFEHLDSHELHVTVPLVIYRNKDGRNSLSNGAVMVHLDTVPTRAQAWNSVLWLSAGLLVTFMMTGGVGLLLLELLVVRRLTDLAGLLEKRETGSHLPTGLMSDNDEIGLVAKALDHALTRSDQTMQNLTNQQGAMDAHAIVSVTDLAGNITYVNERFCAISKFSRAELMGQNHRILRSGHHPLDFFSDLWRTITDGRIWRGEICNRSKDGTLYWVDATLVPLMNRDGRPHSYIGIKTDITAMVSSREALRQANQTLVEKNLLAERLTKEAQQALEVKSAFLATISHEIRTPMNGIIGMNNLLMDTELNEDQQRMAEAVTNCASSLMSLINNVLDFSKLESSRPELECLPFDLQGMFDELLDLYASKAEHRHLELTCMVAPDVPTRLMGDSGRLRQVLTNLVDNAFKFIRVGEIGIACELMAQKGKTVDLRFSVRDTGIGIPLDKRERLFQPFSQVDSSHTREFGGTGLGLAICKQLTELMGGTIGVESEPSMGSCFWLRLTLDQDPQAKRPEPSFPAQSVLVFEPRQSTRTALVDRLSGWGLAAVGVPDGPSAVNLVRSANAAGQPFQLVMLTIDHGLESSAVDEFFALTSGRVIILAGELARDRAKSLSDRHPAVHLKTPVRGADLQAVLMAAFCGSEVANAIALAAPAQQQKISVRFSSSVRVLVAEDNPVNQTVARGLLRKLGLNEVIAVNTGMEAIEALQNDHFDLVLMDLEMPDLDGIQATQRIRSSDGGVQDPHIPIIAMTGNVEVDIRARCVEVGMDGFIAKPVKIQEVIAILSRWLPPIPVA